VDSEWRPLWATVWRVVRQARLLSGNVVLSRDASPVCLRCPFPLAPRLTVVERHGLTPKQAAPKARHLTIIIQALVVSSFRDCSSKLGTSSLVLPVPCHWRLWDQAVGFSSRSSSRVPSGPAPSTSSPRCECHDEHPHHIIKCIKQFGQPSCHPRMTGCADPVLKRDLVNMAAP
jgi:hypothetical protein